MSKPERISDDDLLALLKNEATNAIGYGDGKLESMRRRNEYYFLGLAKEDLAPPEIEGRSRVVDTSVRNTVLGMEAPLIKTFYGTENVVEFEETNPDDEEKAKQATAYCNYLLRKKNPGYTIVSTWIREALLLKKGFIKVWWDKSDVETREEYRGQTAVQLAMLLDDPEVEPIEQKSYPDDEEMPAYEQAIQALTGQVQQLTVAAQQNPQAAQLLQQASAQLQQLQAEPPTLYDVVMKRVKTGGRLCIENTPGDELRISRRARSLATTPYIGHVVLRTMSYLRSTGYKNLENLPVGDAFGEMNQERVERETYDDDNAFGSSAYTSNDESQQEYWIEESYVQADRDGDGIAEWLKVVTCGDTILEIEECDGHPFVGLDSIPLPHRIFGLCPADLAVEPQRVNTSLLRGQLDNVNLQVNGRYFAVNGQVNLDDLLNSRPGGVVRVTAQNSVGRLDQGVGDSGHAMELMNWFQEFTEESTGWTRQSQGGNGLQLNQTATQANIITNRADSRVEVISRTMAEGGFTDLFTLMLKLVTQYQNKAEQVKLNGKWQNVDPREWTNQFDVSINVGLGTGSKDQQVQHIMALSQKQAEGFPLGVTKPHNVYALNVKLSEALGFKSADQFFTDPDAPPDPNAPPPPPPAPDPNVVKAQAQAEQHKAELEFKAQQAEADRVHSAQLEQFKVQTAADAQMQIDRNRQESEAAQQRMRIEYEAQLEQLKESNRNSQEAERTALERYKAELDANAKIVVAQINAKQQGDAALSAAEDQANREVANGD